MICTMLTQTAEDRLPALLQLLLLLSRDRQAKPLTSSSTQAPSSMTEERIGKVLSYLHGKLPGAKLGDKAGQGCGAKPKLATSVVSTADRHDDKRLRLTAPHRECMCFAGQ